MEIHTPFFFKVVTAGSFDFSFSVKLNQNPQWMDRIRHSSSLWTGRVCDPRLMIRAETSRNSLLSSAKTSTEQTGQDLAEVMRFGCNITFWTLTRICIWFFLCCSFFYVFTSVLNVEVFPTQQHILVSLGYPRPTLVKFLFLSLVVISWWFIVRCFKNGR